MKSKYMAVIPFLFAFGILLISGCSVTTQKSTSSQENMPEIIIGSDDFPPFNYSDENGEPAGIDVDIANEALGRLVISRYLQRLYGMIKIKTWKIRR